MKREEHLAWCKQRALEYVDRGELVEGVTSMLSDMDKHEETKIDPAGALGMLTMLAFQQAAQHDAYSVRRFIEGFN